jgi:hypothetical protein
MRTTCEHFVPLETECGYCASEAEIKRLRARLNRAKNLLTAYWCKCTCRAPETDPCFTCQNLKSFLND